MPGAVGPAIALPYVDVRAHGAVGNGSTDDGAAIQAAHDALPDTGGTLLFSRRPGGLATTYLWDTVLIDKPGVTISCEEGVTCKKKAGGTVSTRGMFQVLGLQPANFTLVGGVWDLNKAAYNGTPIYNGAASALLHCVRSTHLYVQGWPTIRDSAENGLNFWNCAHVYVDGARFERVLNNGLEIVTIDAAADGYVGAASIPDPEVYWLRVYAEDVDDGLNGSGNGCGVLIANNAAAGTIVRQIRCDMIGQGNLRDFWLEVNAVNAWAEQVEVTVQSEAALQTAGGFINVRDGNLWVLAHNPGASGPRLNGAEIAGLILGGAETDQVQAQAIVRDDRASASNYTVHGVRVNAGKNVTLNDSYVHLASHVSQPTPPVGYYVANTSENVYLHNLRARITNPPGGTRAFHAQGFNPVIYIHNCRGVGFGTEFSGFAPGSSAWQGELRQLALVADPTGGTTVDTQARAQLAALLAELKATGRMAS